MGDAYAPLAGSGSGQRRPLEQLHLAEAPVPSEFEIGDRYLRARADDSLGGWWWRCLAAGRITNYLDRQAVAHAKEAIPRVEAKVDHDARRRNPRAIEGDHLLPRAALLPRSGGGAR